METANHEPGFEYMKILRIITLISKKSAASVINTDLANMYQTMTSTKTDFGFVLILQFYFLFYFILF